MPGLLVDTDVLVDHLRGISELRPRRDRLSYSVITRCELFAGRATEEHWVATLLAPLRELAVDRPVAELAGRLRRDVGVATPDALVAATALLHDLALATRNRRHFEPVPRLRLRDPR